MDNTEMVTKISFVFLLAVNFYLIFKLYRLDTEIRKQKIRNDIHEDTVKHIEEKIDRWINHMGEIIDHNQAILNNETKLIDECEAILKENAKINSDAEAILGMYKGLTTRLNEGSNDELL